MQNYGINEVEIKMLNVHKTATVLQHWRSGWRVLPSKATSKSEGLAALNHSARQMGSLMAKVMLQLPDDAAVGLLSSVMASKDEAVSAALRREQLRLASEVHGEDDEMPHDGRAT